jgi:hypothetical protein
LAPCAPGPAPLPTRVRLNDARSRALFSMNRISSIPTSSSQLISTNFDTPPYPDSPHPTTPPSELFYLLPTRCGRWALLNSSPRPVAVHQRRSRAAAAAVTAAAWPSYSVARACQQAILKGFQVLITSSRYVRARKQEAYGCCVRNSSGFVYSRLLPISGG